MDTGQTFKVKVEAMFENFGRERGIIAKIWGFGLNNGQNRSTLVLVLNGFIAFTEKKEKAFASLCSQIEW